MKNVFAFYSQREKDEAVSELEALKDRFEMAQATTNRQSEEKDMMGKELDRLLEKYDRYLNRVLFDAISVGEEIEGRLSLFPMIFFFNGRDHQDDLNFKVAY